MLSLLTILILDPIFDHVIQSENVPGIVGFGLHLTFSSVLECRLCEIDCILFVCRTEIDLLSVHAGGACRWAALAFRLDVHGPMCDRREHTLSGVWQIYWIVAAESHAFQARRWWLKRMVGPARIRFVMVPSLFFRWREELIDVHLGHRSWYHEWSVAVLRLEPTKTSCFLSAL